ncbi:MAG: EAL domain-containing protein [Snowella sp.]|nr:EAL domain-containing protein [Snowella sp.]
MSADELKIRSDLYEALARQQFSLHYQPQIEVATGHFLGVESLIRWQHPKLGWISPAQFIPIAEQTGLIINIGYWVLTQACTQYQNWMRQGIPPFKLSVNLSARQLQQPDLVERIRQILLATGMEPRYLELEITESYKLFDLNTAIATLKNLHQLGIKIAIDDFGIGYSSLSFLKTFPVNTLKIDKSFLEDLITTSKSWIVLQNIIELGHKLNLKIVAEGVENDEQFNTLKKMKCDCIQGYFISRPLNLEEITQFFHQKQKVFQNAIAIS